MNNYDIIIAGAGSVGVPTALALGGMGVNVLVIDKHPSPGQGDNKSAIGGIRATHSEPAKILTALRSLDIFSTWQAQNGRDIEWLKGGYLFPVYRKADQAYFLDLIPKQKKYGLNVDFIGPERVIELAPGIAEAGLIGGSFSPDDGSASPLLAVDAFYQKAVEKGIEFRFSEGIDSVCVQKGNITGVTTSKGRYGAPVVIDAAGAHSAELNRRMGVAIPVFPDSHEGAISEPVRRFFNCMIVDLRPAEGSKNYYFYQNRLGQVIFCITPDPVIPGMDRRETSVFLPQVSARMVQLMPRLKNLRVRRVWRGRYPMSPDGSPLVGWNRDIKGLFHLTGMCGQGFMLGPGIGEVAAAAVTGSSSERDKIILEEFSPYRHFEGDEALK